MNLFNVPTKFAFTALVALGCLGNSAAALAQVPQGAQPAGSWLYTVTIPVDETPADNIVFGGVETYIPGGSYIETDQLSFSPTLGLSTPSHGSWASTSSSEFLLTYLNFSYDSTGTPQGMGRVRQTARLSADGQSYTGSGDFTYYDTAGNVVLAGTFTVTATRIRVEAPSQVVYDPAFSQHLKAYTLFRRVSPGRK